MADNYRTPDSTQRKIAEIRSETDPQRALEGMVDLLENFPNKEANVPVRFDEKTGQPLTYSWRASATRFKPQVYLGGKNLRTPDPNDTNEPGLAKIVSEFVKEKGPVLVNTNLGKYVFIYEERDASGSEQGGYTYEATERTISVRKVYELKEKRGE